MSAWLGYAAIVLGLHLVLEAGFRLAQAPRFRRTPEQRSHVNTVVGALLAMLAFVLAFTFSNVDNRFSARRELVLREANAIRTAYLRTDLLPGQEAGRSRELLRRYVDVQRAPRPETLEVMRRHAKETYALLWAEAMRALDDEQNTRPVALYIDALNEAIELSEERFTVVARSRLPLIFLILLFASAALAMLVLGFSTGQTESRNPIATVPLILVLSALLLVIVEFDRPDVRIARVSQVAMEDLSTSIQPAAPER